MKKLEVDQVKCIGCGMCAGIDPNHFEIEDTGLSTVISQEEIESENITQAIDSCPTGAISIKDDTEKNEEE